MMLLETNDQQSFVSRAEAVALSAVALLLHGALFWFVLKQPDVTPTIAQHTTAPGDENAVVIDLAASSLPTPVETETPVTPVELPRVQPEPQAVTVDEDAVQQKQKKPTESRRHDTASVPKPEPKKLPPRPKPKPSVATHTSISEQHASPAQRQGVKTTDNAIVRGTAVGNPEQETVTPAISGMQSLGNPPPDYPSMALRRRQEGRVTLRILVLENGRAGEVIVTQSSHSEYLDEAAVNTVKQWRFIPSKRGSVAIQGYAEQSITFTLPR